MARGSVKENKNIYQTTRESLGLTREKASEVLGCLTPDRIEKIESEKIPPHPEDILSMANGYKAPNLCNHYCSTQCPIGKQYVPEIKIKNLAQIVLEMLASLNSMNKQKERLIEIASDGEVDDEEIEDFIYIQEELEKISMTAETLRLWSEKMLATGAIDIGKYQELKEKHLK